MNVQDFLKKSKKIQNVILTFLENENDSERYFQELSDIIDKYKISNDKNELTSFLHLLSKVSKNHNNRPNFISKIEQILQIFLKDIKKSLKNSEIFNIFKGNKRILLFLLEEKILIFDEYVVQIITSEKYSILKYPQYFLPEIKPFMNEQWFPKYEENNFYSSRNEWIIQIKNELPENFYELRKTGENENYICKLIRNDLIDEFIQYVNQNNYSLKSTIKYSNYETNSLLIKKQNESQFYINSLKQNPFSRSSNFEQNETLTLIKYAAFFGSIRIFKYLQINNVELIPQLWLFAIHGNNAEIINILVENKIMPYPYQRGNPYEQCFVESIKCHHNDIANYILENYLGNETSIKIFIQFIKYYNFSFIQSESINQKTFPFICQYDYYTLTSILLNDENININNKVSFSGRDQKTARSARAFYLLKIQYFNI